MFGWSTPAQTSNLLGHQKQNALVGQQQHQQQPNKSIKREFGSTKPEAQQSAATGTGLFGAAANTGSPATATSSFSGFGAAQTTSSTFGQATAPATTDGNIFLPCSVSVALPPQIPRQVHT